MAVNWGIMSTARINRKFLAGARIEVRWPDRVERIELEPVNSYRLETENMSAAIRGEAPPLLGRADAVGQARAMQALYAAAGDE